MLSIKWNNLISKWEIADASGHVLWNGNKYSDAAQFAEDYSREKTIRDSISEPLK